MAQVEGPTAGSGPGRHTINPDSLLISFGAEPPPLSAASASC